MRKWLVGALIALLSFGGVAYAADAVAPTLTDVYNLLLEIREELATVKEQTSWAEANESGTLATAKSNDGKVSITITSLMAGPDATVIGFTITNEGTGEIMMSSIGSTSITAAGHEIEIDSLADGLRGNVLPATSKKGVILAEPLPGKATEITFKTKLVDTTTYSTVLQPTFTLKLK